MGRREHLEMTLPFMLSTFDKVIVVDWSCPQGSGGYASSEGASVVYKYGEKYFDAARAKNYGAKLVTTEYVCFVDADSFCMPGLKDELQSLLCPDSMILSARNSDGTDIEDTVGFLACPLSAFCDVGGFEECWTGWGGEDLQLRGKLLLDAGLKVKRLSDMKLGAIPHSNSMRAENREGEFMSGVVSNAKKVIEWFASHGVHDYPHNPAVREIVVKNWIQL